jgi:phage terminase large subunit-like protein
VSSFKSVLAEGQDRASELTARELPLLFDAFPLKFYWMAQHGYLPHIWQAVFHGARNPASGNLARFRHLAAGRRGGKTLSAAWEVVYYALHPEAFHRDVHGIEATRPLWMWVLTKDFPAGDPARKAFFEVLHQVGLVKNRDYTYNKTEQRVEFNNGTLLQFKTAVDPATLRGPGLDLLWMDEAAFIPNREAWDVVRPALSDKVGLLLTTTTPDGENWLYEEFFDGAALKDPRQFRVEYVSLDNPYFPRDEWQYAKETLHPVVFKREYMASFKAMSGVALAGDWLHYWTPGDSDPTKSDVSIKHLRNEDGRFNLRVFMGVDPAVSQADDADYFAIAVVGIEESGERGYLLDTFLGRVPFPDQTDLIREWQLKWRPELIGVEANAFQAALAQQANRLDTFPGIVPVFAKGKKNERILAMAPLFKIGKMRILRTMSDFIGQWLSFDPEKKNQKDDLLDAVEIATELAGVLLPMMPHESLLDQKPTDHSDVQAQVLAQIRSQLQESDDHFDPDLGSTY